MMCEAKLGDVCGLILELCSHFRSMIVASNDEDVMIRSTGPQIDVLDQGMHQLSAMMQRVSVEDYQSLIDQLTSTFQTSLIGATLTEGMVDSVDQLFSSLSLKSQKSDNSDLENICGLLRYILTAEKLETAALVSHMQHFCVL